MNKKVLIITIVSVVLIIVGYIGFNIYQKSQLHSNPEDIVGNTSGNLYNEGLFCEDEEYVYFSNPYDNYSLYRMRPDETELQKISTTEAKSINADDKYIYYYQEGSGGNAGLGYLISTSGIYRIDKKHIDKITCIDRILGNYLLLSGNNLYYTCADDIISLKKSDIYGKTKETLIESNVLPASIQDSTLYYTNDTENLHLMAYNLQTNSSHQVIADDIYMPIIEGNIVYGIDIHNDYALVKLDALTGVKTVLDETRTDMLNVTPQYIYYQTSGDNPQLKRIGKSGQNSEVVMDGAHNKINATSKYVYFTPFRKETPVYRTPITGPIKISTFDAAQTAALEQIKK